MAASNRSGFSILLIIGALLILIGLITAMTAVINAIAALSVTVIGLVLLLAVITNKLGFIPFVILVIIVGLFGSIISEVINDWMVPKTREALDIAPSRYAAEPVAPQKTIKSQVDEDKCWPAYSDGSCSSITVKPGKGYNDYVSPEQYTDFWFESSGGRWCDGTKWDSNGNCTGLWHGEEYRTQHGMLSPRSGSPFLIIPDKGVTVRNLTFHWKQLELKEMENPNYDAEYAKYKAKLRIWEGEKKAATENWQSSGKDKGFDWWKFIIGVVIFFGGIAILALSGGVGKLGGGQPENEQQRPQPMPFPDEYAGYYDDPDDE